MEKATRAFWAQEFKKSATKEDKEFINALGRKFRRERILKRKKEAGQ